MGTGVITPIQHGQYSTPVVIILKKVRTVRFITDYFRINQKLVRKPYPLLIIGKTMHQMEGLQFAAALDLNMGYYTIRLSPASQYMTNIVTEFGKFRYNRLPTDMCFLGDKFQAKVNELLFDIKGIKTYINDILVLSND